VGERSPARRELLRALLPASADLSAAQLTQHRVIKPCWCHLAWQQPSHNPEVAGSNPAPATGKAPETGLFCSLDRDRTPSLEPELTFIALAGDEVVGYAILDSLGGEPRHRLTPSSGPCADIATALKRAQMQAATKKGYARLVTTNEERNRPIRSINRALGYRPRAQSEHDRDARPSAPS
jgi:hypothetical protein